MLKKAPFCTYKRSFLLKPIFGMILVWIIENIIKLKL